MSNARYNLFPSKPAFHAYPNSSSTNNWTGSAGSVIPFDTTEFDIGNNYNTTSYRFTAPEAGTYFFYVKITSYTWYGDWGFYVNGVQKREVEHRAASSNWDARTDMTAFVLSADDYVDVRVQLSQGGSYTIDGLSPLYESFGGFLVS